MKKNNSIKSFMVSVFILMVLSVSMIAGMAVSAIASSESVGKVMMPRYDDGASAFGQNQYYSVMFDEEGDAIVAAKLKIQNTGKENLSIVSIEIPGESIRMINIFQEVQGTQKYCAQWDDFCTLTSESGKCTNFERKCVSWQDQQVWPPYYYSVDKKENQLSKSVQYTFTLPVPLDEQQVGTILMYYKVQGYVSKGWGIYDFDFESAKMDQDVASVRIAVNVQQDLILEGGQSKVDYRGDGLSYAVAESAPSAKAVQSNELQQFSSQLEWQQGYVKTVEGLDPLESFHVKGTYGTSWLMMHKISLIVGILLLVAVIFGLVLAIKRLSEERMSSIVVLIITGVAAGFLILLNVLFFTYIVRNMTQWVGYDYGQLLSLLLVLLASIITLALLIAPAVYIGLKKGISKGFLVLGITIITLVLLSIMAIVFLAIVSSSAIATPIGTRVY